MLSSYPCETIYLVLCDLKKKPISNLIKKCGKKVWRLSCAGTGVENIDSICKNVTKNVEKSLVCRVHKFETLILQH